MPATDQIELQIDHHPSGRYTLKRREGDEPCFHDYLEDGLRTELNAEVFLKAFYLKVQALMDRGVLVKLGRFPDTTTTEGAS